MKAGKRFEKLTKIIFSQLVTNPEYEKVEHNVMLEGKDGPRQIDVLIQSRVAGIEIKTIIECKDYNDKVSVGVIDSLHSVMEDVCANKGVVVSSNGFSSKAISKARRLGISLYTAHEALSEKWKIDTEIPVLVTEISSVNMKANAKFSVPYKTEIQADSFYTINDVNISEAFSNYLKNLALNDASALKKDGNHYLPESISHPFFIRDSYGNKINIEDFSLTFSTEKRFYFGYLNNQRDVLALKDILNNGIDIIFKPDFLIDYKTALKRIPESEIPSIGQISLSCITKPDFDKVYTTPVVLKQK